jgi:hypothetical protein
VAAGAVFSLYIGALTLLFRRPEMTVEMLAEFLATMTKHYLEGISRSHR